MTRTACRIAAFAMAAAAVCVPAAAQQFSNNYSRLNLDRCLQVERPDADTRAYRCRGFANSPDHDVYVFEDDDRYYVSFGRNPYELKSAGQTLAPYNTIGDDLEWRLVREAGEWHPFAAIIRYFTEVEENGAFYRGEVLAVVKIGPDEACHAAYIDADANANANRIARETADSMVRRFDCATQEPVVIGERGRALGPTS